MICTLAVASIALHISVSVTILLLRLARSPSRHRSWLLDIIPILSVLTVST
jgi:hypothetical protein